jgi:S-adenosylmethionine decarboxylase
MNQTQDFKESLGPHLQLDLHDCDPVLLADFELIYDFLRSMVQKLQMTEVYPPYVVKYTPAKGYEDAGISGFVLIAESHISIHTWPEKFYASLDFFSCKDFAISTPSITTRE